MMDKLNEKATLDERILAELSRDSRQSLRAIATRLGVSPASVLSHIRAMENKGIILGYGVNLNYDALGYELMGVIHVTIRKGALLSVQREIAKIPEVISVYDVTGDTDSLVLVRVKHRYELSRIVKKILKLDHVEHSNTRLVLNTIKENYRLMPLENVQVG